MNITCLNCGQAFLITADQLGTRGKCPHCFATILLPKSERAYVASGNRKRPFAWTENSLSGAASILFHMLILALFMFVPWNAASTPDRNEGLSVEIGSMREESLVNNPQQWDLSAIEVARIAAPEMSLDKLQPPTDDGEWSSARIASPFDSAASGTEDATGFGSLSSSDPTDDGLRDFGQLVEKLKRDGLDIVITFDSTGSMDAEIRQVKSKIERIGGALFKLVPKTRISICTYRDEGDVYVTQGLKLTDNLSKVAEYLGAISAEGGGDMPEAVDQGLAWAIEQNQFRHGARKVILLFGDAPPHSDKQNACLTLASNFRHHQKGTISTVTCHSDDRLPDFVEIALAGGGESFLSRNDREIMTQLMVLVFGSQHQQKVVDALDLLRQ